jgi:glycosyltransferase involved in cell wall biosynthesis
MKKILMYNDADHLGGHELQMINALKFLQYEYKIIFVVSSNNSNFIDHLKELELEIIEIDYSSNRFQIIRTLFSFNHIFNMIRILKITNPDLIINVQGNIELCSSILIVSKITRHKIISYIPNCHFLTNVTKNGLISKIKDLINVFYYKLPDTFITLNDFNEKLIRKRNSKSKVYKVLNCIDFKNYKFHNKSTSINKLGLSEGKINIALIGRIQYWHKGHDIILNFVKKYREHLKDFNFIIVGTGEDENKMKKFITNEKLEDYFTFLGHLKDLSYLYSAVDGVIIPSRFESGLGTPMVLLEAIYYELPVLMSKLPESDNYLDLNSLFEVDNLNDLSSKFFTSIFKKNDKKMKDKITKLHSIERFQFEFDKVLKSHVK